MESRLQFAPSEFQALNAFRNRLITGSVKGRKQVDFVDADPPVDETKIEPPMFNVGQLERPVHFLRVAVLANELQFLFVKLIIGKSIDIGFDFPRLAVPPDIGN